MHHKKNDKKISGLKEILSLYIVIFVLWMGYRFFFTLPEMVDEFIAKPILWLSPLFLLQKRNLLSIVRTFRINILYSVIFGLFTGVIYFFLYVVLSSFQFGIPSINPTHFSLMGLFLQLLTALSTGLTEEIVFRGFILEKSLSLFNDRILSNSFTTLLFTLIHLPVIIFVYHYSFMETISYLSILIITGYVYGLVYLHKKSLTSSTVMHGVWNFLGTVIR